MVIWIFVAMPSKEEEIHLFLYFLDFNACELFLVILLSLNVTITTGSPLIYSKDIVAFAFLAAGLS